MYIVHARLCVCPSPHSHTTARTRMYLAGMVWDATLLGGFAIGARFSLLRQHTRTRNVSECLYSLYACCFGLDSTVLALLTSPYVGRVAT